MIEETPLFQMGFFIGSETAQWTKRGRQAVAAAISSRARLNKKDSLGLCLGESVTFTVKDGKLVKTRG